MPSITLTIVVHVAVALCIGRTAAPSNAAYIGLHTTINFNYSFS